MTASMFNKLPDSAIATLVTIYIDGQPTMAEAGETVAGVLLRQSNATTRTTPVHESPRTPYCMMGVCFDCLAIVDDIGSIQSCQVAVRDGMKIERQQGRRKVIA